MKFKKKTRRKDIVIRGTCSYIRIYMDAVTGLQLQLYLQHYFYNIIFKMKHT
jgi:hypothetical protein